MKQAANNGGRRRRNRGGGGHKNNRHGNNKNSFDSNGPNGRVKGSAQQLFDKYMAMGNDANASGEHIDAEAFYQFADHYFRINLAANGGGSNHQQQGKPNGHENSHPGQKSNGNGHASAENTNTGRGDSQQHPQQKTGKGKGRQPRHPKAGGRSGKGDDSPVADAG